MVHRACIQVNCVHCSFRNFELKWQRHKNWLHSTIYTCEHKILLAWQFAITVCMLLSLHSIQTIHLKTQLVFRRAIKSATKLRRKSDREREANLNVRCTRPHIKKSGGMVHRLHHVSCIKHDLYAVYKYSCSFGCQLTQSFPWPWLICIFNIFMVNQMQMQKVVLFCRSSHRNKNHKYFR